MRAPNLPSYTYRKFSEEELRASLARVARWPRSSSRRYTLAHIRRELRARRRLARLEASSHD